MVEAFAGDICQHMRNTAHQYRNLAICPHARAKVKLSMGKRAWEMVTVVVQEITEIPECWCPLCRKDRNEPMQHSDSPLPICDSDTVANSPQPIADTPNDSQSDSTIWCGGALETILKQVEPGGGP